MNPRHLFAHFDRISDAPDAIPRLRQFIVDLAVRGKLVEQDDKDEPASALLVEIQRERGHLANVGAKKVERALPSLLSGEVPFAVPARWSWVALTSIGITRTGSTPPSDNPEYFGNHIPFVKPADLTGKTINYSGDGISELGVAHSRLIPRNSALMVCIGSSIGKVNVSDRDICCNQQINAVTPVIPSLTGFVALALRATYFQRLVLSRAGMGTLPIISKAKWELLPIPAPPLAEQHRIAAKVDELMSLCGRLEAAQAERESRRDRLAAASLHRLNQPADTYAPEVFREHARFYLNHLPRLTTRPEQIKQIRQAILNLAVRGQLVPQDPNDEPASELLKRIRAEKVRLAKGAANKHPQPTLPTGAGEPLSVVPEGWEWVRLGSLLLVDSQNGYSKKPDDAADGVPILRISAGTVRKDGIVAEEEHKLIGGVSAAQQEQYKLQCGDLLACRFNGNRAFVGRLSLYLGYLGIKPIYPDKLIRLRLVSQFVLPKLVRCFAESSVVRKEVEDYCATTVGNWGISASNLRGVSIPLPPLAEQHRIVAKVDELMSLCDQLEAQLTTAQTESRRLLEAVLYDALATANPDTL
jgi:type I restriction enzyme S subunit